MDGGVWCLTVTGLQCRGSSVIQSLLNVDSAEGFTPRLGRLHYGHLGLLPSFLLGEKNQPFIQWAHSWHFWQTALLLLGVKTLTLCVASFLISSCSLFKIWRFGLFFLAYCWSSITLLSEFSCKRPAVLSIIRRAGRSKAVELYERTALTADDGSDTHLSASDTSHVKINGNGKQKKKEKHEWIRTFCMNTDTLQPVLKESAYLLNHLIALSAIHTQQRAPVLDVRMQHLQDLLGC